MTSLLAGLARGNLVKESSEMTAILIGAECEGFVLDNEIHSRTYRALRGIDVSDEKLAFEATCSVVPGERLFSAIKETLAAVWRDFFCPATADREAPNEFEQGGRIDVWRRALARTVDILSSQHSEYLMDGQDRTIRQVFRLWAEGRFWTEAFAAPAMRGLTYCKNGICMPM